MIEFRTRRITSSRVGLNILEWGAAAAPPLLLVHGGQDHARSWDAVARALAPDWRVVVPDLRGHGDSDWVSDGLYEMLDFLLDLRALVDALDLPPCPMIGHSLGGNIVTRFAGIYPDRVTKLINVEGLGYSPAKQAELAKIDPADRLRDWLDGRQRVTARLPRQADPEMLAQKVAAKDAHMPIETARELIRLGMRPHADGGFTLKYDPALALPSPIDMSEEQKRGLWAAITCPVLLIYGAQSWASNPAEDGRAAVFRDARVELVEQAGHWVQQDQPERFIALVRDFLA